MPGLFGVPHINKRLKTVTGLRHRNGGGAGLSGIPVASHWSSGKWAAGRQRLDDEVLDN